MHESMPLYSYAKDPDQVNCQYFSSPSATPSVPHAVAGTSRALQRNDSSPPPSPPSNNPDSPSSSTNGTTNTTTSTTTSNNMLTNGSSVSPLSSIASTSSVVGSAAAVSEFITYTFSHFHLLFGKTVDF